MPPPPPPPAQGSRRDGDAFAQDPRQHAGARSCILRVRVGAAQGSRGRPVHQGLADAAARARVVRGPRAARALVRSHAAIEPRDPHGPVSIPMDPHGPVSKPRLPPSEPCVRRRHVGPQVPALCEDGTHTSLVRHDHLPYPWAQVPALCEDDAQDRLGARVQTDARGLPTQGVHPRRRPRVA
eukprot:5858497-Prymnesium_polylepis.1